MLGICKSPSHQATGDRHAKPRGTMKNTGLVYMQGTRFSPVFETLGEVGQFF